MVNLFISYFISYILTLSGYLLGKSTTEEHKEIKKFILIARDSLILIFYILLLLIFHDSLWSIYFIILFIFFFVGKNYKDEIKEFHEIISFSSFILLENIKSEYSYIIIILIWALILEKSLEKFVLKKEIYSLVVLAIVYFIFSLIF